MMDKSRQPVVKCRREACLWKGCEEMDDHPGSKEPKRCEVNMCREIGSFLRRAQV